MGKPSIILLTGLPGTGKTTLATLLSRELHLPTIITERIRSELFPRNTDCHADYDFSSYELEVVYGTVYIIARYLSNTPEGCIIDGIYRSQFRRQQLRRLSEDNNRRFFGLHIVCSEAEAIRRLTLRKKEGSISPAGAKTYYQIAGEYEKVDDSVLTFDTTDRSPMSILGEILEKIGD